VIYFIQDKASGAIKIGYSKNARKRLASLQTATLHELVLLGTIHGGLGHETAFHERFAGYALQGEWFKGDILRDVLEIIAKDAANPQRQKTNVIVAGDSDSFFAWSTEQRQMAERAKLEATVFQALDEIHAKAPVAWVITGGERLLDHFAWQRADRNKVQVYRYFPKWSRCGRFAAFKVGPLMLRSMFDPKVLLVLVSDKVSSNTQALIRKVQKAGIEVVKRCYAVDAPSPFPHLTR
jgi:hypothetical protein